ncbi:MAG: F-box protein [Verrucomicrobia bacterium]|nr:F-box protein [Verrucomicrobiota bacterium]
MSSSSSTSSATVSKHVVMVTPEDPNRSCPIGMMPVEILQHIFRYLSDEEQFNVVKTCKAWQEQVVWGRVKVFNTSEWAKNTHLQMKLFQIIFPPSYVDRFNVAKASKALQEEAERSRGTLINASEWEKYIYLEVSGLSFEGLVVPSREVLTPVVYNLAHLGENDQGVSVIAIPKGLSLSKLLVIAEEWGVRPYYIWEEVVPAIGAIETQWPYYAVISNSVLQGSRGKTIQERDALVQSVGCAVPSTTELLTVMVFHYIMRSKRLFSDKRCAMSLTSDSVEGWRLAIGAFMPSGYHVEDAGNMSFMFGVAGVRRF